MERAAVRLARSPLFGAMSEEELGRMIAACWEVRYAKGDVVDNDAGLEWFNIVLEGRVKLLQSDPLSGRSFVSFLLEEGISSI